MSCGVGHRNGLDPKLLWLWHTLAAVAPVGPLAGKHSKAASAAKKKKKKKKKIELQGKIELREQLSRIPLVTHKKR